MEVIKPFWSVYNIFDRMKTNDEECPHILNRLEALQELVVFVQQMEPEQLSEDVKNALVKLTSILDSANKALTKFSKIKMVTHMMKSSDYKLEFEKLNKSLTDAYITLSGALHVHQEWKLVKQQGVLTEQENKLHEQEVKLANQERRLAEQEEKLAEQEDILQRVESNLFHGSRAYYCVLQ